MVFCLTPAATYRETQEARSKKRSVTQDFLCTFLPLGAVARKPRFEYPSCFPSVREGIWGQERLQQGMTSEQCLKGVFFGSVQRDPLRAPEAPNWSQRLIASPNQHLADKGTTKSTPHGATGALEGRKLSPRDGPKQCRSCRTAQKPARRGTPGSV